MITDITVKAYKTIDNETICFKPLTIVAGPNSVGKSSLLQALMVGSLGENHNIEIIEDYSKYEIVFNRNLQDQPIVITIHDNNHERITELKEKENNWPLTMPLRKLEENFFILAANRNTINRYERIPDKTIKYGINGQYAVGTFYVYRDKMLHPNLKNPMADSMTLKSQLAWWLSFITDNECKFTTTKIDSNTVQVLFSQNDMEDIDPNNIGTGYNYLVKLLIVCLLAKPDDIIVIENPEIHLHPKAQSKLGKFFAFVAKAGIQLIMETHCEHLIDGIRYEVFKQNLESKNVCILYKQSTDKHFKYIGLQKQGYYCDINEEICNFPDGFFDATLQELLEMS